MEVRDLYCYQCSLQFDNKCIFNDHLSKVHGIVFDVKRVQDFKQSNLAVSFIGNKQNNETEESKMSKNEASYMKEKKIHRVEKTYSCKLCHKKFTKSGILKVHERIHTGEKPFSCKICSKKFSEKFSLKVHERKFHDKHFSDPSSVDKKKQILTNDNLKKLQDYIDRNGLKSLSVSKC